MKIKIATTLFYHTKIEQYIDTDKPVNHIRTDRHPRKGEDVITELFLQAMKDAEDVSIMTHISLSEVMYFYDIALAYHEEQMQYMRDFRF